jgi:hypothetical protein
MDGLMRRTASLADLKAIWELVKDGADDIAFDVESAAAQEAMLSEIMACCTSGLSPLAVDDDGLVAALLVRRDDFEWGFRNSPAVHVAVATVARKPEQLGLLDALIADVQARGAPVFASVKKGDQLGLENLLRRSGFVHEAAAESGWGDLYAWSAPPLLN